MDIERDNIVRYRTCYRSKGYPGGWRWETLIGFVKKVNKKTVWICRVYEPTVIGHPARKMPIDRVVEVEP